MHGMWFSPFIVPLGAFAVAIVAIAGGVYSQVQSRRIRAEQRMAMLARGISIAEIETILAAESEREEEKMVASPQRRLGTARRTAMVLISSGVGIMLFFVMLEVILGVRQVLCGAAVGLVPLAIGLGFVVDYHLQKREMARFGLEVGEEPSR